MLKLAGAGMVLVAFAVLGYAKSLSLKLRCESIARVLYSLRIMENEISYGKISMDKVMESIKKLGGISAENPSGDSAGEWFLNAVEYEKLEKADMEVLTSFSKTLGITDTVSQQRNIKNTVKTLELLEIDAKNNYEKYGKMYRNIGFLTGMLAVILLM